jgi:ribonuclease Y
VGGLLAGRVVGRRRRPTDGPSPREAAERLLAEARLEREAGVRDAEIGAREEALVHRASAEETFGRRRRRWAAATTALVQAEAEVATRGQELESARGRLREREEPLREREAERDRHRRAAAEALAGTRALLERVSGERAEALQRALAEAEVEAARGAGAQLVRLATESVSDPEHVRNAKRVMGIAVGRFEGHYLTERHHSLIPLGPPRNGRPAVIDEDLRAIESVANIKLTLAETGDAVRIEGLDGVAREVARRCLARLLKRPVSGEGAVARMARAIAHELDREVMDLGRRAFTALEIDRAHPDIVKLVGASTGAPATPEPVEARGGGGLPVRHDGRGAGLDAELARRAALMHDIGKALTHELDGSHAVIGADYARRLGEAEVVANAIGAHHTDEPFASPYAYLVAASDAMSGRAGRAPAGRGQPHGQDRRPRAHHRGFQAWPRPSRCKAGARCG